ncbi:bZIP transcription factor hapX [Penicillium diatomitis]|uniref:BZIP transcription factor hapX n=1 Tax=Penicillium diatomitis TaxID=2819901 RepID=A0A9X0C2M6_9EURO|nr:bZIP transcription factor hapX [Penicillium diatomitis]KAJ5495219.1 bZIP transcription factor hapX [Penicillium diatomitis]
MATTGVSPTPAPTLAPGPSLAPAIAVRPSVAPSPGPGTPGSITSKEWVIPPRPKPGRKPATDTPPTKRKAQNRAAQRAFRERRAARVQELEEQIKEIEDGHEARVAALTEQMSNLSREMEQAREEVKWWRDRCHALEKEVSIERNAKEALTKELRSSAPTSVTRPSPAAMPDSVPLPPRKRPSTRSPRMETAIQTNQEQARAEDLDNVPLGCNSCSTTHCQCIEDAFGMPIDTHESIRARNSPHGVGSPAGHMSDPEIKPDPEEMEIDFTSRFASAPTQSSSHTENEVSSPPVDPCGFCQDGTPCICAEMAAQEQQRLQTQLRGPRQDSFGNNRLPPMQSISQFTPPPSESDVRSEVTLPPISQATNPCINGPGTCAQCQADPRSTLFCKTLAASRSASSSPSAGGGCCGGKGADGGCCMSRNAPSSSTTRNPLLPTKGVATKPSIPSPLTLSCADAFTTLSRHPNFNQASDEISSWLPKLHTLPNPRDLALAEGHGNRPAMEVEAASVMGVLRYFDRRFANN